MKPRTGRKIEAAQQNNGFQKHLGQSRIKKFDNDNDDNNDDSNTIGITNNSNTKFKY